MRLGGLYMRTKFRLSTPNWAGADILSPAHFRLATPTFEIMTQNPGDQLANREGHLHAKFCSDRMMHVGVMQGNEILCRDWTKL